MISRLARWWLARKEGRFDWSEPDHDDTPWPIGQCVCGKHVAGDDRHIVVAFGDDAALGVKDGGTAMSADFCAEHCPGGCRLGCPVVVS